MNAKLAVISLWAEDVPTAAYFFRDAIGLRLLGHHGDRPHFDLGGVYLTILEGRPVPAQNAAPDRFPIVALIQRIISSNSLTSSAAEAPVA